MLSLVVLAAGMGSRYGGLKQVDGIGPNCTTLLEYSVYDAWQCGFEKFYFIIRQSIAEAFEQVVLKRLPNHINYELVYQELAFLPAGFLPPEGRTKPWGTCHALWCAKNFVKEPFAILNADDFYGRSGFEQVAAFLKGRDTTGAYCMVGYPLLKTMSKAGSVARGLCAQDTNGYLLSIDEKTDIQFNTEGHIICDVNRNVLTLSGTELVSMNFWGFTPDIFNWCEVELVEFLRSHGSDPKAEFYIPKMVNALLQKKLCSVKVLPSKHDWIGVTYAEDKEIAGQSISRLVDEGMYPKQLW